MQQTTNYKLNKPGMDDTFAVAPLNENADKLDGALAALDSRVAAADAKHCLFRLPDPEVVPSGSGCSMDLSGMGIEQYDALAMVYCFPGSYPSSIIMKINGLPGPVLLEAHSGSNTNGVGVVLLLPVNGYIYGLSNICTTYDKSGSSSGATRAHRTPLAWSDVTTFGTDSAGTTGKFHLFGLKL